MLKGKNTLYFMIPLNILIWGYVSFKIYSAFTEKESIPLMKNTMPPPVEYIDTSEYVLSLDYEDPFLKSESAPRQGKVSNSVKKEAAAPKNKIEKAEEKKKEIKYLGIISNTEKGIMTVLVTIDGSSYILKKGDVANGVKLEMITRDKLTVRVGKEKITVQKL